MNNTEIKNITEKYYVDVFNRFSPAFVSGKGCTLTDADGKQYTDFFGGIAVSCLGYGDKELTGAITKQAKELLHISGLFYSKAQAEFLEKLCGLTGFPKAFICNSGAEANEAAIKLIRKTASKQGTGKYKILCLENSFHGRTVTTATATGQPKYSAPFAPLTPGFMHVPLNDAAALKEAFKDKELGGVIVETIQGESGVIPMNKGFADALNKLCKDNGVLLCVDEVQTGIYRTGNILSHKAFGLDADIITLAKGLGGGVPIGAMICTENAARAFEKGDHGSTFGGNPLACAAASAVLDKLHKGGFDRKVKSTGSYLKKALNGLNSPHMIEVRGEGLLIGMQLKSDINARDIVIKMLNKGFIINASGNNTLRFAPPYIIKKAEIDDMVTALKGVL